MKTKLLITSLVLHLYIVTFGQALKKQPQRPNIVIILADDMGFSDIGCYGSEIPTPNLDKLAETGLRFTQFYNAARCCPTRASLLTGLWQHQAGVGMMTADGTKENVPEGYVGHLNEHCVTIAEVAKSAGYHTYMAGKWHVGDAVPEWWPNQRGFEQFYGITHGACSYWRPTFESGFMCNNDSLDAPTDPDYYTTNAFADFAVRVIKEQKDDKPFLCYLAFNAPHWPLQAPGDEIAKFRGKYKEIGWDKLREERWKRQLELGIVKKEWGLSPRDSIVPAWETLTEKEKDDLDYRMATYAAMVHVMDKNIGKLVAALKETGKFDNTLIMFLSDNGACPEPWNDLNPTGKAHLGGGKVEDINNPEKRGYPSYGQGWANACNTPFRKYKTKSHEGGISTPLVVSWPKGLKVKPGSITDTPGYLPDFMATIVELTGAEYPKKRNGVNIYPCVGKSLLPVFKTGTRKPHEVMFWEHRLEGAVRQGDWKAVLTENNNRWYLYNVKNDRTELHDMSKMNPKKLKQLSTKWQQWANENFVFPKE